MVPFLPCPGFMAPGNKEVETGVAPLTITPSDPLAKCLFPFPGEMLPPRDAKIISLNWKLRLPAGQFGLLVPQIKGQRRV